MSSDDIGFDDPTDFTTTQLQVLDEHLRCPICKELFNTTMLLSTCSHSFCALCIRRSLSAEQKCPKCRKEGIEKNLIHNYDLDNVVRSWKDSRKLLVSLDKPSSTTKEPTEIQVPIGQHNDDFQPSRSISQNTSVAPNARRSTRISSQTKPNYVEIQSNTYPETSEPHRQLNLAQNQPLPAPPAPIDQVQPYSADYPIHFNPTISNYQPLPQMQYSYTTQPTPPPPPPSMPSSSTTSMSSHTSRPPENMVECPICQQSMHQTVVNIHLDRCLKGDRSIPVINQSSSHQSPLSSNPRPSVMNTLPIAKKKSSVNLGQKPIKQVTTQLH
ncbi:hypothetical protein BD560DRAFT_404255 [Blakeslea trispora]|nr:hypothetical protein BD560DRAFT_404255 [Blakeslea trispora]